MGSFWDKASDRYCKAALRNAPQVTYTPQTGAPLAASALLLASQIEQSAAPGYFASIAVDPLVVVNPLRDDLVTWTDGVTYIVGRVINPPYGLVTLALHRQSDPVGIDQI